jgi:hypothetical protein
VVTALANEFALAAGTLRGKKVKVRRDRDA